MTPPTGRGIKRVCVNKSLKWALNNTSLKLTCSMMIDCFGFIISRLTPHRYFVVFSHINLSACLSFHHLLSMIKLLSGESQT